VKRAVQRAMTPDVLLAGEGTHRLDDRTQGGLTMTASQVRASPL
jgi:hypothetical protein